MTPTTIAIIVIASVMILISLIIIVVSLLMSPDSNAFSGALVGSGDLELFKNSKERGFKKVLKWVMLISGLILMILAVAIWALSSRK